MVASAAVVGATLVVGATVVVGVSVVVFLTLAAGIPGGWIILRPFFEGHF